MKKLIAVIAVIVLFASCGKHVKDLHRTSVEDLSTLKTTDLSLIITTEKIDTNLKIPGFVLTGTINTDTLSDSGTITKTFTNDEGVDLTVTFDRKNNKVTATAKKLDSKVNVKLDKTTTQHSNITTEQKNNVTIKTTDKHTERDYSVVTKWIVIGVIIIVIIALFWFFGLPKLKKNG